MDQDMPPAPPGERYEDLIEVFTVLGRTLAEDESVHDTLQSILALALRLVPGCTAASVVIAHVLHVVVERPAQRFARRVSVSARA